MVECGRHLNIEILTLSEILSVDGHPGAFNVSVRKRPRYIEMEKCIACGLCAQKCPKKVDDEFNMAVSKRKAAYIQYGQTVPLKYLIDPNHCLYLNKGKCRACEKFCPTGAINFEDTEKIVQIDVGSLIVSPGYKPFDATPFDFYGYDEIPDVVTSLEFERLLSASGPNQGHLIKPSDLREPQKIAWIQCVGSRNTNRCDNGYCSSVCCMYAIKQALVTAEHLAGENIRQTIFYMDMRSHGKEFERYYQDAIGKGIQFVRARPHTINPGSDGIGVSMMYTTEEGRQLNEAFDMAVLSIGMEASRDALELSEKLGIQLNRHNFAQTTSFTPVSSSREGIFVSGSFQAPMAIPRSVTQASTAAAEASLILAEAKGSLTKTKTYPDEMVIGAEAPRIGVFVCSCGINIAKVVDVAAVVDYAQTRPHVVYVENNLFTCSTDTQDLIAAKVKEHNLNRIVIAACTPRTHEPLFQDTLKEAGLNGYLIEMANIRNHNAWVHQDEPERATVKAKDQLRMALAKVTMALPLDTIKVDVVQKALVVGGGLSGMTAALGLAGQGYAVALLEKADRLGGMAWKLDRTFEGEGIPEQTRHLIASIEQNDRIRVYMPAELKSASGSVGNFVSTVTVDGEDIEVSYGAAVIATGAKESQPDEYGYGQDERIMTHLEFDAASKAFPATKKAADSVVFIQCVGSRDEKRPYCSRVCCTHTMQKAIELKEKQPDINVYVLYRDIRTYGLRETDYQKARQLGVIFIRYDLDTKPEVTLDAPGGPIQVGVSDPILQMPLSISADYLVLAAAIVPNQNEDLVSLYKCSVNSEGFLNEAHPKLRPVDMSVDGLFVAGLCNFPKPVDESIAQAKAAVSRANVILSKSVMELDPIKSFVTDSCDGCALCIDVCPYKAIGLIEVANADDTAGDFHKQIQTDSALCKGCGLCEATCPKGGVLVHGFTNNQLKAQVDAALEPVRMRASAGKAMIN